EPPADVVPEPVGPKKRRRATSGPVLTPEA
ncbi:MAG: hypothetical protein JWO22_427, partial [Frankiales bacterium]|nr:hypothetical protein [Frankiales bacterium]